MMKVMYDVMMTYEEIHHRTHAEHKRAAKKQRRFRVKNKQKKHAKMVRKFDNGHLLAYIRRRHRLRVRAHIHVVNRSPIIMYECSSVSCYCWLKGSGSSSHIFVIDYCACYCSSCCCICYCSSVVTCWSS